MRVERATGRRFRPLPPTSPAMRGGDLRFLTPEAKRQDHSAASIDASGRTAASAQAARPRRSVGRAAARRSKARLAADRSPPACCRGRRRPGSRAPCRAGSRRSAPAPCGCRGSRRGPGGDPGTERHAWLPGSARKGIGEPLLARVAERDGTAGRCRCRPLCDEVALPAGQRLDRDIDVLPGGEAGADPDRAGSQRSQIGGHRVFPHPRIDQDAGDAMADAGDHGQVGSRKNHGFTVACQGRPASPAPAPAPPTRRRASATPSSIASSNAMPRRSTGTAASRSITTPQPVLNSVRAIAEAMSPVPSTSATGGRHGEGGGMDVHGLASGSVRGCAVRRPGRRGMPGVRPGRPGASPPRHAPAPDRACRVPADHRRAGHARTAHGGPRRCPSACPARFGAQRPNRVGSSAS